MITSLSNFYEQAGAVVVVLDVLMTRQLRTLLCADHISYKCAHRDEFERIRWLFEDEGASHWTARVSGRSISYIILPKPIPTALGNIRYLELSDQKPDGSQKSGFDHIEVYPLDCDRPLEEIVLLLNALGVSKVSFTNRPHHPTYDLVINEAGFELRLEKEALIETIVRREILPG